MKPLSFTRLAIPPSLLREVTDRASTMSGVIHLEGSTPNFSTPRHILEAAHEAAQQGYTRYTPSGGLPELRVALAHKIRRRNGYETHPENVIVTAGSGPGLTLLFLALADPGESILIPDPAWPNYELALRAHQIEPRRYPLRPENGFLPRVEEIAEQITHETKAILVNSPANPTGAVFPRATIQQLYDLARELDLYLISDETYEQIIFEGQHVSPAQFDTDGRVISVYSFSHDYAMTGWRVGYVVAPLEIARLLARLQEAHGSCACSVSQKAAEAALKGPQDAVQSMVEAYRQRRDIALTMLQSMDLQAHEPAGAFYLLINLADLPVADARTFALALLEEKKVAVAPGPAFGEMARNDVRVCFAVEEKDLVEGLERLGAFVRGIRS